MSICQSSKAYAGRAASLVKKIRELSNEIVIATSQVDPVNKYCFDGAIAERAKTVESAKEKYNVAALEFENVNDQLKSAKNRFDSINGEYIRVREENTTLKSEIDGMKGKERVEDELPECNESRSKLNLYKKMTGIHFDLNVAVDDLTGFVAIRGDGKHHSGLVPFAIKKDDPDISVILWGKIGEVLHTVAEDHSDAAGMHLQNRLDSK